VTPETDQDKPAKKYAYDPHPDPQLAWAGKAERTSFEVPTVSLHVHERIDPRTIIEAVRKKNGDGQPTQGSLFDRRDENPPLREAIDFYRHPHGWSNRLIAGDSLLVMNSLLEKEGMAGQVQMVYIDPPYGIKYGSNFQPFVNRREVRDGKDEDLTQEPEMVKAFRDTWELGIHSYLAYLRDRLELARELVHESGSVFVQISDENVHLVRNLMDEVFGVKNFCCQIAFQKTGGFAPELVSSVYDYLIWYSRDREKIKFRKLFQEKEQSLIDAGYTWLEQRNGERRRLTASELSGESQLPEGRRFQTSILVLTCND
jgi:adenine-specific DNA-methyltransferase